MIGEEQQGPVSPLGTVEAGQVPMQPGVPSPSGSPPIDPPRADADPVMRRLDDLLAQMEEMNRLSQERERIIDRLHAEVQSLRQGEVQQALAPLVRDLIRLFDDLSRMSDESRTRNGAGGEAVAQTLAGYRDEVGDILYRYGLDRYDVSAGARFDPKEHRALTAVTTQVADQDGCVARVVRAGFRSGPRIVRHLEADVFRFVQVAIATEPTTTSGGSSGTQ